mgnify:CR=1 FL=1
MSEEKRDQEIQESSVQKIPERGEKDDPQTAAIWCVYQALAPCSGLGINMNDNICVRPCPTPPDTCPNRTTLKLHNAAGTYVCTIRVQNIGALHCVNCPQGGHRFVWI